MNVLNALFHNSKLCVFFFYNLNVAFFSDQFAQLVKRGCFRCLVSQHPWERKSLLDECDMS